MDRKKSDRYLDRDSRRDFVDLIRHNVRMFVIQPSALAATSQRRPDTCRDREDLKFLALAIASKSDAIVIGDEDLHVLHPWRGIPILTAARFLDH